jgi:transcriptional regulator with GAF, ATPase, and Fis domain
MFSLSTSQIITSSRAGSLHRISREWQAACLRDRQLATGIPLRGRFQGLDPRSETKAYSDRAGCMQTHRSVSISSDEVDRGNLTRPPVSKPTGSGPIIGRSAALLGALQQAERVALTDSTVLLLGETGTGKELFASHIHQLSSRRGRPMICVNTAAIPATLIESELFGRERGAYTDAGDRQAGRFELADRSSLFLDEIGELPLDVQVKLLRVIEERQVERLGSVRGVTINTRIIAATNRSLEERVAAGQFRADLFYRLNVFPIRLPSLRERPDDIPLLIWRFVDEFAMRFGKEIAEIRSDNMEALQRHSWPGNIRELRNAVERAMILATGPRLNVPIPSAVSGARAHSVRLVDVQRDHIRKILETANWRVRGTNGAADRLGLRPTTLETRMAKLGLTRPKAS